MSRFWKRHGAAEPTRADAFRERRELEPFSCAGRVAGESGRGGRIAAAGIIYWECRSSEGCGTTKSRTPTAEATLELLEVCKERSERRASRRQESMCSSASGQGRPGDKAAWTI